MSSVTIAVPHERADGERRVSLDPERVARLLELPGIAVQIESECGRAAGFYDGDYIGASVMHSYADVVSGADVVVKVRCPDLDEIKRLSPGTVLICLMAAFKHPDEIEALRSAGVTVIAMDHIPRIARARAMDAVSSQATVAGYKAALLAAELSPRVFPMLTTAAGTLRPSRVIVIGAGVAGLQAIATARRLGAEVEAYDIRQAAREQIESLGARMIETGVVAEGPGGYARSLNKDERQKQHDVLREHMSRAHAVICSAAIPGRRAPRIVTEDMVDAMLPDTVIVDLTAESGGNCALTVPGEQIVHNDVLIVGALNLPSHGAVHASEMYARNVFNLLSLILPDGELTLDPADEIIARSVLIHGGVITHEATAAQLKQPYVAFGQPVVETPDEPDGSAGWISGDDVDDATTADAPSSTGVSVETVLVGSDLTIDPADPQDNEAAKAASLRSAGNSAAGSSARASSNPEANTGESSGSLADTAASTNADTEAGWVRADGVAGSPDQTSEEHASTLSDPETSDGEAPLPADDLTVIDGIGPATQDRLNGFGVRRFRQLAELDTDACENLATQLDLDDAAVVVAWADQAERFLMTESGESSS